MYVFTNADTVELYKNGNFVTNLNSGPWSSLPHGPLKTGHSIGRLLETEEGYPPERARALREYLTSASKFDIENLPALLKLKISKTLKKYGMSFEDAQRLYGKYAGNWGGAATVWRLDAKKDGKVVRSITRNSSAVLHLEVRASHTVLTEGERYDAAALRIRILDEHGNPAPMPRSPPSSPRKAPRGSSVPPR